jgi:hypothetical protein
MKFEISANGRKVIRDLWFLPQFASDPMTAKVFNEVEARILDMGFNSPGYYAPLNVGARFGDRQVKGPCRHLE